MRRRKEWEPYEFADLARYNDERAHGIVHTSEWDAKMAAEQGRFNAQQMASYRPGDIIVYGDGTRRCV